MPLTARLNALLLDYIQYVFSDSWSSIVSAPDGASASQQCQSSEHLGDITRLVETCRARFCRLSDYWQPRCYGNKSLLLCLRGFDNVM